jgi:hypothetical protein
MDREALSSAFSGEEEVLRGWMNEASRVRVQHRLMLLQIPRYVSRCFHHI